MFFSISVKKQIKYVYCAISLEAAKVIIRVSYITDYLHAKIISNEFTLL